MQAREFWLTMCSDEVFYSEQEAVKYVSNWPNATSLDVIHVIEFAAYEKLRDAIEESLEARKKKLDWTADDILEKALKAVEGEDGI